MIRAGLLVLLILPFSPVYGCELAAAERKELEPGLTLFYRVKAPPIAVTRHFSMQFLVCEQGVAAAVKRFKLDARMPAHKHGMNYRAAIVIGEDGLINASGLLFHMPGRWRISVDFATEAAIHQVKLDYQI